MADLIQVNTPNTLLDMGVNDALKLRAINKKLEMESLLDDIFETLGENIVATGQNVAVPNAIFMKLSAVPTGAREVTIPLLMALTGAAYVGPGTPVGSEHKQNLKYSTFYYQEYSYAVASTAWGTNYNDMSVYGVFEKIQPQISIYMKELRGKRIREALLYTYDSVLTGTPDDGTSSAPLKPQFNKNWFVANTSIGDQPKFSSFNANIGTKDNMFTVEITNALRAAGGATGTGTFANITLNYLLSLDYYAKNVLRIDPIKVDGKETYVVLIPSTQVNILKRDNTGQLGDIYTSMVRKNEDVMEYTGAIGRVGSLLLIEDQRYPTLEVDGAVAEATLSAEFLNPGNDDSRLKGGYDGATNESWDVGFLLGQASVCEWTVRELHFETETQNYGYNKGTGAFGESGISLVEYDVSSDDGWWNAGADPTLATRENYGSIVLTWTTPVISA